MRPSQNAPPAFCLLPSVLESTRKQTRKAQHREEGRQRALPFLEAITGDDNLIAGQKINRVRRLTFVNGRDVHGNRSEIATLLFAQNENFLLVARLQDTA